MVRLPDGHVLNLHLGPAEAVADIAEDIEVGETIRFRAFRTPKLPAGQYIAQSIRIDGRVVQLRDKQTLRPVWAGRVEPAPARARRPVPAG